MLKIFNVKWEIDTAGPSPYNNKRTELFFLGCKKAMQGQACNGCFNSSTWSIDNVEIEHSIEYTVQNIIKFAPSKYITIGGGEPTDQIEDLIELCKRLKNHDFHIIVYTWRQLKEVLNNNEENISHDNLKNNMLELLNYIDILIDGQYINSLRIYNEQLGDGTFNSIGSSNQIVWDIKNKNNGIIEGQKIEYLDALHLTTDNNLIYIVKSKETSFEKINLNESVLSI